MYIPDDTDPLYRDTDPPIEKPNSGILTPQKRAISSKNSLIPGY